MNTPAKSMEKKSSRRTKKKRETFKEVLQQWWQDLQPHASHYATIVVAVLAVFWLIRPPSAIDLNRFQINQRSPRVVQAPFEFEYVDKEATKAKRDQEAKFVPPIYQKKPEQSQTFHQRLQKAVELIRSTTRPESMTTNQWVQTVVGQLPFEIENRLYADTGNLPADIPKSTYECIAFYKNYESLWTNILKHAKEAEGLGIANNVEPLREKNSSRNDLIVGAELVEPDGTISINPAINAIKTKDEYLRDFRERMEDSFPNPNKDYAARELAVDLVKSAFPGPSLIFQEDTTEAKRQAARNRIDPITIHVNKEVTIIGKDDIVTESHLQKLEALREQMSISIYAEIGYFIMALLLVIVVLNYVSIYNRDIRQDSKKIMVIFAGIILVLILSRIVENLSLLDLGSNTLKQVGYGVPVGALGVIITILACPRLAMFLCVISALYMGIIFSGGTEILSLHYVIVAIITSCGAIFTVSRIRQRSDLYRAGGIAIVLATLTILAITLQQKKSFEQIILHAQEVKYALIWGAVNGGLISILSMAFLPLFEDFFGVTTDIKLLELSQKNELLQRLEQEAPGSYQHSMRVATLAESASEAIGANALLTRVGTYYHDIGKVLKPQYFVENQQTRADKAKHEKIKPTMSCLIIRNHVKHGMELAKEYNLPKVIADFIPEHHGTTLMTYFYHQALASQETEGTVKEEDYRYPGPKPQSKETAILMLADSLEAASRTLKKPKEGDVRQLVRKVINDRYMDGQFDECNLTLKDLHTLFISFSDSILHTMHQRIDYPEAPKKAEDKEAGKEKERGKTIEHLPPQKKE